MKKTTKGALAASAALVLLLSTGGTLAYWNSTVDLGGAAITAGNLAVAADGTPTWTLTYGTLAPVTLTPEQLATVRIVPGDTLTFSADYDITAQGRDLVIEAALDDSATFTINGTEGAQATIAHRSDDSTTYDVSIDVTLEWPFGTEADAPADLAARGGQVDLSDFRIAITQVPATN